MQKFLKQLILSLSIMLAVAPIASVYAQGGDMPSSNSGSGSNTAEKERESLEMHKQELKMRQPVIDKDARERVAERAKEFEKEGEKEKKHDPEQRKKTCQERKLGLETKLSNLVKNAQKHHDRITSHLDKAVKYVEDKNITDNNVAAAILKATEAKSTSTASIAALKELTPTIDCNSTSVSSDIAKFKSAAELARNNLRSYMKSVKQVYEALEVVRENTESNSGSTQ